MRRTELTGDDARGEKNRMECRNAGMPDSRNPQLPDCPDSRTLEIPDSPTPVLAESRDPGIRKFRNPGRTGDREDTEAPSAVPTGLRPTGSKLV